ncbi:MAG: hypothetical protein ACNS62_06545 [Candidatus Cyclobacteriaceae bacterium M3_2C_046]
MKLKETSYSSYSISQFQGLIQVLIDKVGHQMSLSHKNQKEFRAFSDYHMITMVKKADKWSISIESVDPDS